MLGIFRKNLFVNSILILPFIVLLRLNTFLNPIAYAPDRETSTTITYRFFEIINNGFTQSIIATLLIFIQSVIINRIVISNRLSLKTTLFSGVIYATLISTFPSFNLFTEYILGNTFLLLAIANMMKVFNKNYESSKVLNTGIYMGLAILISPEYMVIALYGIAAIVLFTANVKNILQYITGVLITGIFTYSINYVFNLDVLASMRPYYPSLNVSFITAKGYLHKEVIALAIGLIYVLYLYGKINLKKGIGARNKINSLYILLLLTLLVFITYPAQHQSQLLIPAIPIATFIGVEWSRIKNRTIVEIYYLLILLVLIYFQFVS